MNLQYKGYIAEIKCSIITNAFIGEVVNCAAAISFAASKQEDLLLAFRIAVDQYLEHTMLSQYIPIENEAQLC